MVVFLVPLGCDLLQSHLREHLSMTFKELEKELLKAGYTLKRIRGRHYLYFKDGARPEIIPNHGSKDLSEGLVKSVLKRIRRQ